MSGHTHTHDGIDWVERISDMRRMDAIHAPFVTPVAERVIGLVEPGATVVDIGSGAGGISAALGRALVAKGGGRIVLVDAVPQMLEAAASHVRSALGGAIEVNTVLADVAAGGIAEVVGPADLVWASGVVHHLPDQRRGLADLYALLNDGGWLALGEGGMPSRCLPWDVGVGEPGLQDRLLAAREQWFARMRADMDGVVRLPVGWNTALAETGLRDVSSFSYLIDLPAPAPPEVRGWAGAWLRWMAEGAEEWLGEDDRKALAVLTDPDGGAYVGDRDDVFMLSALTIYLGRKGSA
ncbi:trans-aconitate methyltransferase [Herbihabitans rhizosphaerae]|uniref:Trans-aconitate methyltransferase n=1 Tax=Herbihabitans rhizosphaerae TaxID=1872711 RepID=A0A4Q7KG81_9PSEU|nr:methyltransferase [Herbihabitans rhizosphaerae]RZS32237.1 trans-aconitate methyltransferase [Herbihabitans rhizosphaerae]